MHDEMSNDELRGLLKEWTVPPVSAAVREAVLRRPWWKRAWCFSIRVPVPVACCLALLFALFAIRLAAPGRERIVVRTERVEVPVVRERVVTRTVYRNRIVRVPAPGAPEWRPVAVLRPQIIRRDRAEN